MKLLEEKMYLLPVLLVFIIFTSDYVYPQNVFPCGKNCTCTQFLNASIKFIADCSSLGLNAIPLDLPGNITDLYLSKNNLNLLAIARQPVCKAYVNLTTLSFAWNQIKKMSPLFIGCSKLIELDLTGNILEILNSKSFQGLSNIKKITGLEVINLDADTFKSLINLDTLNLTYHGNVRNMQMFKDLNLLTQLEINLKKMTHPDSHFLHFESWNSLKFLKINCPLVKGFPPTLLSELNSLEHFILNAPSLLFLRLEKEGKPLLLKRLEIFSVRKIDPDLLSYLSNLEVLKLHKIMNADKLKLAASLKDLEVVQCFIPGLPENWFINLTLLENLTLSYNSLSFADNRDFSNLKSLKYLDLSGNTFTYLPSYFLQPMNCCLQKFIMNASGLERLQDNAISDMAALTVIDLSNNYIEEIGLGNFENIPNLNILNLHDNYIPSGSVNKSWFFAAHDKIELNLSNNNLNGIPEAVLDSSISVLDLAGNNITLVPVEGLCVMSNMTSLILADNPLHCDTSLEELLRCLPDVKVTGKCKTPLNVQHCLISQLSTCLMKSQFSSLETREVFTELVTYETSTSTERLMNMVKEESDVSAIVRPIVTFQYNLAEATEKSFMKDTETTVKLDNINRAKTSRSESELINNSDRTEQNVHFITPVSEITNTLQNTEDESVIVSKSVKQGLEETADQPNNYSFQANMIFSRLFINSSITSPFTQVINSSMYTVSNRTTEAADVKQLSGVKGINSSWSDVFDVWLTGNTTEKNANYTAVAFDYFRLFMTPNTSDIFTVTDKFQSEVTESNRQQSNYEQMKSSTSTGFANVFSKETSYITSQDKFKVYDIDRFGNEALKNKNITFQKAPLDFSTMNLSTIESEYSNILSSANASDSNFNIFITNSVIESSESSPSLKSVPENSRHNLSGEFSQSTNPTQNQYTNGDVHLNSASNGLHFTDSTIVSLSGKKGVDYFLTETNVTDVEDSGNYNYSRDQDIQIFVQNKDHSVKFAPISDNNRTKITPSTEDGQSISFNPTVKQNIILKNVSKNKEGINQIIQLNSSIKKPEEKTGQETTVQKTDANPSNHSGAHVSPNLLVLPDMLNALKTAPSDSVSPAPNSKKKIDVGRPVPVYIKSSNDPVIPSNISFGSIVATVVVIVTLLLIIGAGFLWYKKFWQTGSYNAASNGTERQFDQVSISLTSVNKSA